MSKEPDITRSEEWMALIEHFNSIRDKDLRSLFSSNLNRAKEMTFRAADLILDISKHRCDQETIALLLSLARRCNLEQRRDAMFAGAHINSTENRAVLHSALRMPSSSVLEVDGQDVVSLVHSVLNRMGELSDQIRDGRWTGYKGSRIRNIVNIGIGGSDLGDSMAYEALRDYASPELTCRFVSNIDPIDLYQKTCDLDPGSTLFVICSKTFATVETLTNARVAREWILEHFNGDENAIAKHFVAVSTNAQAVSEFGIDTDNMLEFWDWVGGRYSYDSAVGFSLMIAIGQTAFEEMLSGFHAMDEHFRTTELEHNLPVLQGMLNVWYNNFFGAETHAVLPYSQRLSRFPAYLQQLTMESNGKSVRRDGTSVLAQTGEIFWGEPGTNGQHAFYQLIHQGTKLIPADFIAFAESTHDVGDQHDLLVANCFAQSAALAFGKNRREVEADGTPPELVPHKVMPGNRPSSTLLSQKLTPRVLGELVAFYEHVVFTEGVIWQIDSFDQWGVELGKVMAKQLEPSLVSAEPPDMTGHDSSTQNLVVEYRAMNGRSV